MEIVNPQTIGPNTITNLEVVALNRMILFNASGTFTAPKSGKYLCRCYGGGGGGGAGGGVTTTVGSGAWSGYGGSAGQEAIGILTLASGSVYTITIGAGGAGGVGVSAGKGGDGGAGNGSIVVDPVLTTLIAAGGGFAGAGATPNAPVGTLFYEEHWGAGNGGGQGRVLVAVEGAGQVGGPGWGTTGAGGGGGGGAYTLAGTAAPGGDGGPGASGSVVLSW